jgi:hypothetical protein
MTMNGCANRSVSALGAAFQNDGILATSAMFGLA